MKFIQTAQSWPSWQPKAPSNRQESNEKDTPVVWCSLADQSPVVTTCITYRYHNTLSTMPTQSVFKCFESFSEQIAIIFLKKFNWLVLIDCFLCGRNWNVIRKGDECHFSNGSWIRRQTNHTRGWLMLLKNGTLRTEQTNQLTNQLTN